MKNITNHEDGTKRVLLEVTYDNNSIMGVIELLEDMSATLFKARNMLQTCFHISDEALGVIEVKQDDH